MKIIPMAPTGQMPIDTAPDNSKTNAEAARARAIAMLAGHTSPSPTANAQQTPVQNPSNISAEEVIKTLEVASPEAVQTTESTIQSDNTEEAPKSASQEVTKTPEEEVPLSTQYANLARKEKALRDKSVAQSQQLKAREAALAAKEAEFAAKSTTIDTTKYISVDDLKRNAYGKLQEHGIQYDDITQQAVLAQSPEMQAIKEIRLDLERELQKVRDEQVKTRQTYEQQQAQAYQQALNQIKSEATQLVTADPAFETIKETGRVNDVVQLIERTFQEDGTLLTVEQAAQAVEEHLIEEALKYAKLAKVQAKLKPQVEPKSSASKTTVAQQQTTQEKPQPQQATMKTLTNAVSSTRPLTARERAILAMRGELNKS